MDAAVFQSHLERQPPPSPHKLRSRTARLAAQQLAAASPPPLPRPPRLFLPAPSATPPPPPPPTEEPPPSLILQILSHPRLPLLLLSPLAILLAYTLHVLVLGLLHAQHLAHEKPWSALARMLEARAREAQWNSLAAVARVFAPAPAEEPGLAARLGRWMGLV